MAYYTELTEHYLRLAVRSPVMKDEVSKQWHHIASLWIFSQSPEDQAFIEEVFKYEHWKTSDGLKAVPGSYTGNRKRLDKLLKEFAIYTELYSKEDTRK